MTRPGRPRWFERVPSWALSAAAVPFTLRRPTATQVAWLAYVTGLAAIVGATAGAFR